MDFFLWLLLGIWLGSELWISLREWGEADTAQDRHTKKVFAFCAAAAISIGLLGPRPPAYTIYHSRAIMLFLGSATMLLGISLRVLSVLALGQYFRTTVMIQKGQTVIKTGPYKYIRHPSYLGTLITVFGFGLAVDNWFVTGAMLAVMFYGIAQRIAVEEEVMERGFGKAYIDYKRKTKKLIPKIY